MQRVFISKNGVIKGLNLLKNFYSLLKNEFPFQDFLVLCYILNQVSIFKIPLKTLLIFLYFLLIQIHCQINFRPN